MLCQGRIVWATVPDQSGQNQKCRPLVILTPDEKIDPAGKIVVAAATTIFDKPLPENKVPLPWQHDGHPVTKLRKPCVVVCDWLEVISESEIEGYGGIVPKRLMFQILLQLPPSTDT